MCNIQRSTSSVDYITNKKVFLIMNSDHNRNINTINIVGFSQRPYCCVHNIIQTCVLSGEFLCTNKDDKLIV